MLGAADNIRPARWRHYGSELVTAIARDLAAAACAALACLALLPLVPAWPYWTRIAQIQRYFSSSLVTSIPEGRVVVLYPFS